jgi:alcohol dehydrogenase class IV
MSGFRYVSHAQEVIFAPGALAQFGEAVKRAGWTRVLLCASRSMKSNGNLARVQTLVGERLAATFDLVNPHVQDVQVEEVLTLARKHEVDAVLGLGGGSPIGMAKAVGFQVSLPILAIPTTYAGSEMTAVYGVTHTRENPPRKVTVANPNIAPKVVIYDPELTLDLPPSLTASTGVNALAHCLEALYSVTRHPLSTAAALDGIRHISNALLSCYQDGDDLEARMEMLLGAHLAGFSLASVSMGLHHGLCHVLGGTANVPHGIANSIILPHAIRFNADSTAPLLLPAAEAMGISLTGSTPDGAMEALAQTVYELVRRMDLPQRLRDAGVPESQLSNLAQLAFQNRTVHNNPKPIQDPGQLEDLLRAAW